jgi:hypothetical protein
MATSDPYLLAGVNLRTFVAQWVTDLEAGGSQMRGLLEHAATDPIASERYSYGAHYVMANIAPCAARPDASSEELLLYAVMQVYQDADFPDANLQVWDGEEAHVRRAFAYFHTVGEREAARRLRNEVIRRSLRERPSALEEMLRRSMQDDLGRRAAHDREMASLDARSLRAAKLLDPDGDFDRELTAAPL